MAIRRPVLAPYWRSREALEAYAKAVQCEQLPASVNGNRSLRESGVVEIWNEPYRIAAGTHEGIYTKMPAFGLGRATNLTPVNQRGETGRERMAASEEPAASSGLESGR